MKKIFTISLAIMMCILGISCSNEVSVQQADTIKPVKTITLKNETKPVLLNYIGTVNYNEIKKLGFKSPGKIEKVYVTKGEKISKGSLLAKLDTKDLKFSYEASKAQLDASKSQYTKALDAYNFANDTYERIKNMYEKNAISKQKYEEAKLQLDIRQSELNQANELKNQAKVDFDYKESLLQDATLKADSNGYIVDTLFKEGEMVSAGYPVVVVRNDNKIVNVGLTQEDIVKIKLGDTAQIKANNTVVEGTITNISELPDTDTRTYNVELALNENNFKIGFIVNVDIQIGEESGIWIPIKSIKSNSQDYVYVVNNDIANEKTIQIESINKTSAKVTGLNDNDKLVIQGISMLVNGDKVKIED